MAGIQFTSYVPTSLVGNNSPSPTLAAEVVTGLPIPTGAFPGNVFYLTEAQANQLSASAVNAATQLTCHGGWYMVVQVAATAVAANIKPGTVGAQAALTTTSASVPPQAIVTDGATAATAGYLGLNPVVFLNAVTPGNYTIVQVAGDATLLLAASQTVAAGTILVSATPGTLATSTTYTSLVAGISEQAFNSPAAAFTLSAVAAASGGSTVYTGTITGGTTPNYVGQTFVVAGFTGAAAVDNGTFLCTACSTTTLTLSNPSGVAVTAAGTATAANLIRASVNFPFGVV